MYLKISQFRLLSLCLSGFFSVIPALERTVGVNATLETQAGTRSAALGGAALAVPSDLPALSQNPHQLATQQHSEITFTHVGYYEDTQYDFAAMGWPLGSLGGLGVAVSRFGATGIPLIRENDPLPEGSNYATFSLSDWVVTGAWGRSFGKTSLGLSAHGLKRDLDQSGWGFRADFSGRYQWSPRWEVSALLKGWTSTAARWESGQTEYYSPELQLGFHASEPFPYFYGVAHVFWQSAGVFHRENRDLEWDGNVFDTTSTSVSVRGKTPWQDPLDWLQGGSLGFEFQLAQKLSLRAGVQQIGLLSSWTAGFGVHPLRWFQASYAFQNHPILSGVHRASITLFPGILMNPTATPPVARPQAIMVPPEPAPPTTPSESFEESSSDTTDHSAESGDSQNSGSLYWEE